MFADAWVVPGCTLSATTTSVLGGRRFDREAGTYETTLVFAAGPNAHAASQKAQPSSTMRRTYCAAARDSYPFVREGVKWALRASLDAAARQGCTVALLAAVSCGLYAGPHKERIGAALPKIVDELLVEPVPPHHLPRGLYFERVVVTRLGESDTVGATPPPKPEARSHEEWALFAARVAANPVHFRFRERRSYFTQSPTAAPHRNGFTIGSSSSGGGGGASGGGGGGALASGAAGGAGGPAPAARAAAAAAAARAPRRRIGRRRLRLDRHLTLVAPAPPSTGASSFFTCMVIPDVSSTAGGAAAAGAAAAPAPPPAAGGADGVCPSRRSRMRMMAANSGASRRTRPSA